MDNVLQGLNGCAAAYIDDVIIYSKNWTDHLKQINLVLEHLRNTKLTCKPSKCVFAASFCVYLGHVIGNGEVHMDPSKLAAIYRLAPPKRKKDVRSFLGISGYC